MGSINTMFRPKRWRKERFVGYAKNTKEPVYQVIIGECDDEFIYDITVLMIESHYDNCVSGKWKVKTHAYAEIPIEIFDENGNKVEPYMEKIY